MTNKGFFFFFALMIPQRN